MSLPISIRRSMFETMVRSRFWDDRLTEQYWIDKTPVFAFGAGPLPGELHTSHGQEPVGSGVCAALKDEDMITTGHRPHHIAVARGVNLKEMSAELFGKKAGLSGGEAGTCTFMISELTSVLVVLSRKDWVLRRGWLLPEKCRKSQEWH